MSDVRRRDGGAIVIRPSFAQEVANADRALVNELPSKQARRSNGLVESAKRIQRLQTKAAKLRRQLKAVQFEIRHEKKMLRGLATYVDKVQL